MAAVVAVQSVGGPSTAAQSVVGPSAAAQSVGGHHGGPSTKAAVGTKTPSPRNNHRSTGMLVIARRRRVCSFVSVVDAGYCAATVCLFLRFCCCSSKAVVVNLLYLKKE